MVLQIPGCSTHRLLELSSICPPSIVVSFTDNPSEDRLQYLSSLGWLGSRNVNKTTSISDCWLRLYGNSLTVLFTVPVVVLNCIFRVPETV